MILILWIDHKLYDKKLKEIIRKLSPAAYCLPKHVVRHFGSASKGAMKTLLAFPADFFMQIEPTNIEVKVVFFLIISGIFCLHIFRGGQQSKTYSCELEIFLLNPKDVYTCTSPPLWYRFSTEPDRSPPHTLWNFRNGIIIITLRDPLRHWTFLVFACLFLGFTFAWQVVQKKLKKIMINACSTCQFCWEISINFFSFPFNFYMIFPQNVKPYELTLQNSSAVYILNEYDSWN